MAVNDPLRIAGRAARVAHGRGSRLVNLWTPEVAGLALQELFVSQWIARKAGWIADDDDVLHRGQVRHDRRQDRDEARVHNNYGVFRVIDDVCNLIGKEAY